MESGLTDAELARLMAQQSRQNNPRSVSPVNRNNSSSPTFNEIVRQNQRQEINISRQPAEEQKASSVVR